MATTKTKKYMPEVQAKGKGTAAGALIGTLIKKGVLDKEKTRTRAKQYRKLTGKGLSDGQAISKIKLYESLLIKPKTPKKQEGGQAVTSGRMTRLGNKIARKTTAGKAVSTGLQKRFDKATDKVIIKQLKKSTKEKSKGAKGWSEDEAGGNSGMARRGGAVKKVLRKANNGIITGSTTPTPTPTSTPAVKEIAFSPPTAEEQKYLQTVWEQRNKKKAPAGTEFIPSSENFRTRSGGFNVYIKPTPKTVTPPVPTEKRRGIKMAKGGMAKTKRFAALAPPYNKATAADRIAGAKKNKRK